MPQPEKDPFYKLAAAAIYDRNLVKFYQMPIHLRQNLVNRQQEASDAVSKHHKKQKIIIILCVKF